MDFIYYDLKQVNSGRIVEVTMKSAANVRLMTSSNFNNFKAGRAYRYYGGFVQRSPFKIPVPSTAHWYVVIDLGGYAGQVSASVRVLDGFLPSAKQTPLASVPSLNLSNYNSIENDNDIIEREYDVFISHASEDKDEVARPLALELSNYNLKVWYDEFELKIGDSLRRKIDKGLANSKFGIVIISNNFINKGWPNYELDGLITRSISNEQQLLPIWHKITKQEVINYSPTLADKVARNTASNSIEEIAQEIAQVINGV